ncbi:hypothetical protein AMR41_07940 [Hapalosiphon sp. MRB220]|nr:hypothetical protein AMR41_07940 [Hapalosiphon sp. MRB220]
MHLVTAWLYLRRILPFLPLTSLLEDKRVYHQCTPDKILLRKRAVIESVNDHLKNICQIQHSRHRSPFNFWVNLMASLVAYTYLPQKPSIDIYPKDLPALPPAIF